MRLLATEQIKLGSGAYGPSGSRAEPWPSFPFLLCRLTEFENEIIRLADRGVFGAVGGAFLVGWRQGPDTLRIILRVARVGVHLGAADQFEAGLFRERDRVVLAHIAVVGFRVLRNVGAAAVLLQARMPPGFSTRKNAANIVSA